MENKEFEEFLKFMEGKVPNPNQYPQQFEFAVRTYLFCKNYKTSNKES